MNRCAIIQSFVTYCRLLNKFVFRDYKQSEKEGLHYMDYDNFSVIWSSNSKSCVWSHVMYCLNITILCLTVMCSTFLLYRMPVCVQKIKFTNVVERNTHSSLLLLANEMPQKMDKLSINESLVEYKQILKFHILLCKLEIFSILSLYEFHITQRLFMGDYKFYTNSEFWR